MNYFIHFFLLQVLVLYLNEKYKIQKDGSEYNLERQKQHKRNIESNRNNYKTPNDRISRPSTKGFGRLPCSMHDTYRDVFCTKSTHSENHVKGNKILITTV